MTAFWGETTNAIVRIGIIVTASQQMQIACTAIRCDKKNVSMRWD